VNIVLHDYVALIQGMRIILAQIQRNTELHQSPSSKVLDIHWEEVKPLYKITDELETDLVFQSYCRRKYQSETEREVNVGQDED
jgi:hypothetical protein